MTRPPDPTPRSSDLVELKSGLVELKSGLVELKSGRAELKSGFSGLTNSSGLAELTDPAGLVGLTLEARLRAVAAAHGSAPAILDGAGVRATHADLGRMRAGGRARLRAAGVRPGDRTALVRASDWQLAVSLLAASSAGGAATVDPRLTDRELTDGLTRLRPSAIVTDKENEDRVRALVPAGIPVLRWDVTELDAPVDDTLPDPHDVAILLFTSGTTANPKITRLTQLNIGVGSASIARTLGLGPADRALNVMTLQHGHGVFPGTLAPLMGGGSTVITTLTDPASLLDTLRATAPTWYSAAPVVHHSILAMVRSEPAIARLLRPRVIRSTSSALAPAVMAELTRTFGAPVVEAYALSEAPGQIASNPLDRPQKPGTVGPPQDATIVLLTETGELSDVPGTAGEVLVRGPNVMPGYLDVPDAEQPFHDGWLRTGDQGSFDEDGYLALSGRVSEVINRGAEKIAPAEIEAVLTEHPAVREAAAFGRPHPTLGEVPAVAVVLHEPAGATEAELIDHAARGLASFKVPVAVHILQSLPLGKTGKIVRRRLRDLTARQPAAGGRRLAPPR